MKRYRAVFWEEQVVRKFFTVDAKNKAEAIKKFEAEKGMKFEHEEFVERTDGGNLIKEHGVCEIEIIPEPESKPEITREQFMEFFRSDDFHSKITPDDAEEIFSSVMFGSDDFSVKLLNDILKDYDAGFLVIDEEERIKINTKGKGDYVTVHIGHWSYCFSYGIEVAKWNLKTGEKFHRRGDFYFTHQQACHVKKFFGGSDNMTKIEYYSLGGQ